MTNLKFNKLIFTLSFFLFYTLTIIASIPSKAIMGDVSIVIEVTSATCDNADGAIAFDIAGGVPPYDIVPNDLSGLSQGIYDFTISDSGGCIIDTSVFVSEDNGLSAFVDVVDDISCSGNQTAETLINVAGGSGSYLVMIDGNPSVSEISTGIFSTNLMGGSYGITITDTDDNCMLIDNFAVGQPSPIIISVEITSIDSCSGRILDVDISGSGGTPPYNIDVDAMSGGVLVTVTDNEGCTETLFVDNPELDDALVFEQILSYSAEAGEEDGSIDITVAGGNPPYVYQWRDADNNVLSTDEDIEDLAPGIYIVNVSDSKGCTITSGEIEVELSTSVNEVKSNEYNVFPNPNGLDYCFIKGTKNPITIYQLLNANGTLISSGRINDYSSKVTLPSNLPSGVYYIKIGSEEDRLEVHKLLKI